MTSRPTAFLSFVTLVTFAATSFDAHAQTYAQLKKLSECELDRLFAEAPPGTIPVGYARGQALLMTDAKLPKLKARLSSSVWKGKTFEENGEYINQWVGFQALRGKAEPGVSLYDGKPCLVFAYTPDTPLFGNTFDEIREIAPGLYLGRLYERCPCPRFKGYIAIQACGACR